MAGWIRRHGVLCLSVVILTLTYLIIRLFLTPDILSRTHFSRAYYDRNGKLLRLTLSMDEKYRLFTPLAQISPALWRATILYEDRWFKWHPGVNPVALGRAAGAYFFTSGRHIGASTITMQVARLRYNLDTKTPGGKFKQILYALYLDAFYTKDDILEAYLNLAPYGGNIEGIGAASLIYFDKRSLDLSQIESITLATIPQNPVMRGLTTTRGLNNIMRMRRDLVKRWVRRYPGDADKLTTLADMPLHVSRMADLPFLAPHFTDREIGKHNNYWKDFGNKNAEIRTTLDYPLQQKLEQVLQAEVLKHKAVGVQNAAAVLVNYKTMDVLAHIGSVDYFDKNILGENDGVYARRSPGSTLKPFIYAMAADMGLIHGMTLLRDARVNFGVYAPENSDNEFFGPVLARDALIHSRNIPAIDLIRRCGTKKFYNMLKKAGISGLKDPGHYGISIALGGAELSMIDLATLYAMMANLGDLRGIKTTLDASNEQHEQLLSPESFFLVLDMLGSQGGMDRTVPFAKKHGTRLNHYWKTGTSSSYRDAWTAGIFGDYVLIVWVGNFDGRPNNYFSGAKTAAPIYFALAGAAADHARTSGRPVQNPNFNRDDLNISRVEMCDKVGGLAGVNCPKAVMAYFIPGKSPIDTSSVYRSIPIDKKTGKRACGFDPQTTYRDVFEFWDPDYLDMFARAGIRRKTPPPYVENCNLDGISDNRSKPVILAPIDRTKIVIVSGKNTENVTFKAITSTPDVKIFWFLNNAMIGTSTSGTVFQIAVPMGEHALRAVDELGAATEIGFAVVN